MFGRPLVLLGVAASAAAQVPATPVLQNAFANPGLAVAADLGGGGGRSFYGLAAALGLGAGRIQLSGATGAERGSASTRGAYGGRAAVSVWTSPAGALGAGAFAGFGGAPRTIANGVVTSAAVMIVPVGVSLGYRRPIGASRGISVYASPFYKWERLDDGTVSTAGSMRGSLGVDLALSQNLGVTFGGELGQGSGAAGSSKFGAAISFVPLGFGRGGQ